MFASTHLVGSPPFFMTICLHCLGETDPKVLKKEKAKQFNCFFLVDIPVVVAVYFLVKIGKLLDKWEIE